MIGGENMERKIIKLPSTSGRVSMKAISGHFATTHSHVNYYLDMTEVKTNGRMAEECGYILAHKFTSSMEINTIMCLEETQIIGGFLAQKLSKDGFRGINRGENIYIVTPETNKASQMIFRDNIRQLIEGKNVLMLVSSVATGKTVEQGIECINYYKGNCCAVASIFSAVESVGNVKIHSLFHVNDIPDYCSYNVMDCPKCKNGQSIEALVNGFGYFKV